MGTREKTENRQEHANTHQEIGKTSRKAHSVGYVFALLQAQRCRLKA